MSACRAPICLGASCASRAANAFCGGAQMSLRAAGGQGLARHVRRGGKLRPVFLCWLLLVTILARHRRIWAPHHSPLLHGFPERILAISRNFPSRRGVQKKRVLCLMLLISYAVSLAEMRGLLAPLERRALQKSLRRCLKRNWRFRKPISH